MFDDVMKNMKMSWWHIHDIIPERAREKPPKTSWISKWSRLRRYVPDLDWQLYWPYMPLLRKWRRSTTVRFSRQIFSPNFPAFFKNKIVLPFMSLHMRIFCRDCATTDSVHAVWPHENVFLRQSHKKKTIKMYFDTIKFLWFLIQNFVEIWS